MTALRTIFSVMLLLLSTLLFGQGAANQKADGLCKVESLPSDIQNRLKEEYGSWKIQEPADLSQRAREAWEPEKPLACPGIAVGHFESAKSLSYAVLLIPTGHPDEGYRFLVFSQKLGQPGYEVRVLDKLDEKGAANYYIQSTPISVRAVPSAPGVGRTRHPRLGAAQQLWLLYRNHQETTDLRNLQHYRALQGAIR